MIKKHAYLIMAHNELYVLERLLGLIDDERNDIFIHIDKKCNEITEEMLQKVINKSNLYFLKERKDLKWGGVSLVECEISLLELALNKGNYEYYHLLSGVDLPIKSQDYIHEFFEKNKGMEFIGFNNFDEERKKVAYYYFFQETAPRKSKGKSLKVKFNNFLHVFYRVLDRMIILIQKFLIINRLKNFKGKICRGSQWISITNNLVADLISDKDEILSMYKYTAYPDEIFIQTYAYNSKYRDKIYNLKDEYSGCLRYIDWTRGWPYTFRHDDFNEVINSDKLFARKFNSKVDSKIIDEIYKTICSKN